MPTIDLPADELAAVAAAIRGLIEGDRYPHAPRLDPLRAALARFDAATPMREIPAPAPKNGNETTGANKPDAGISSTRTRPSVRPTPDPKAPPPAKADKRARR